MNYEKGATEVLWDPQFPYILHISEERMLNFSDETYYISTHVLDSLWIEFGVKYSFRLVMSGD